MKRIFLGGNNFWIRRKLQDITVDPPVAAPAGLVLEGWLSLTKAGAEIDAAVRKTLADAGLSADGWYRIYEAEVTPAELTAHLGPLVVNGSRVIYDRVHGAAYDDHEAVEVLAARPVGQ